MSRRRREPVATATRAPSASPPTLVTRLRDAFPPPPAGAMPVDRQSLAVFLLATVLLVAFQYGGRPDFYRGSALEAALRPTAEAALGAQAGLAGFLYWGVASLVLRVVIPMVAFTWLFGEPLARSGWQWRGLRAHLATYALLYVGFLPFVLLAATLPSFQAKYPFYKGAAAGGGVFWLYELSYFTQFVGVEYFFRGFLTFALFKRFGYNALLIMTIPYVMVHFNKPLPEVLGAILAALVLGALALRSGSCVPGIFLHFAVGFTMDVLGIAKASGGMAPALRAIF